MVILDLEPANLQRCRRVISFGKACHDARFHRARNGDGLKGRAQLIDALRYIVAQRFWIGLADLIRVEHRQGHHRQHLACFDVHHEPGRTKCLMACHRTRQFAFHRRLHSLVEGEGNGALACRWIRQLLIEHPFHPHHAAAVHISITKDMGGHQRGQFWSQVFRPVQQLVGMHPDRPGIDRPGEHLAIAIDNVGARRREHIGPNPPVCSVRKNGQPQKSKRDDTGHRAEQKHQNHQPLMGNRERLFL